MPKPMPMLQRVTQMQSSTAQQAPLNTVFAFTPVSFGEGALLTGGGGACGGGGAAFSGGGGSEGAFSLAVDSSDDFCVDRAAGGLAGGAAGCL